MRAGYGSDVIADLLKTFGIEYAAINPGSSFDGLHDSLVKTVDLEHDRKVAPMVTAFQMGKVVRFKSIQNVVRGGC